MTNEQQLTAATEPFASAFAELERLRTECANLKDENTRLRANAHFYAGMLRQAAKRLGETGGGMAHPGYDREHFVSDPCPVGAASDDLEGCQ